MNNALGLFSASLQPSGEYLNRKAGHPHRTMSSPTQIYGPVWPLEVLWHVEPRGRISPQNTDAFPPDHTEGNWTVHANPWIYNWDYFLFYPSKQAVEFFTWCQHRVWCRTMMSNASHLSPISLQELVLGTKKSNLGLWLPTRDCSKPLPCCSHPQEIKI